MQLDDEGKGVGFGAGSTLRCIILAQVSCQMIDGLYR